MTSLSHTREPPRTWGFLTSHALTLLEMTRTPDATVRELAARTHLTERQMHRVLDDLVASGYVARTRVGLAQPLQRRHLAADAPPGSGPPRGRHAARRSHRLERGGDAVSPRPRPARYVQGPVAMSADGPFLLKVAAPTVDSTQYVVAVAETIVMCLMPAS